MAGRGLHFRESLSKPLLNTIPTEGSGDLSHKGKGDKTYEKRKRQSSHMFLVVAKTHKEREGIRNLKKV